MKKNFFAYCLITCLSVYAWLLTGSCAQIGAPTGGPKDTLAPKLVMAEPENFKTRFTGNKITFTFDEYIDVQDIQNNLLMSPYPKTNPQVSFRLRTITVKLKDTLLPNTTYSINFGNAVKDLNESNPYKNMTYVFSTGDSIDSLKLEGKVLLAETGKTDSTLFAMLYKDSPDSAVEQRKPDYIAKVNGNGTFSFANLSAGSYQLYALKDNDGNKKYSSPAEIFGFSNNAVSVSDSTTPVTLYAYAEEKDEKKNTASSLPPKTVKDKKLKYATSLAVGTQSLLKGLDISLNTPLKDIDPSKILLTDSNFKKINITSFLPDSNKQNISLTVNWLENFDYRLVIDKDAFTDTSGATLSKTDTIRFKTKKTEDYGSVLLRFKNFNAEQHPVLQFVLGGEVVKSAVLTSASWSEKLFEPGEYELRILHDANQNGKWDPGNFKKKIQPEIAISLDGKLNIKAKWENEREIELQ